MNVKNLSQDQIENLENYRIFNADGWICVKDYIHNKIKAVNKNNRFYHPVKSVYDRGF